MTFLLRQFEGADYAKARLLWETTPGVGLSDADEPQAVLAFLDRNPGMSFVATDGAVLAGTILCGHDGRRGLIHHLVTAAAYRRKGVGRVLLQAGLHALHQQNIRKCHLLVFRTNQNGLEFWRAVGAQERVELALFSVGTE